MAPKRTGNKPLEFRAVFDTSALFTNSAENLLSHDAADLIQRHSQHPDVKLALYLPDVVLHERQYQMQAKAESCLPAWRKLQSLLGRDLNVTEAEIQQRVQDILRQQLDRHSIQVFPLDTTKVDWKRLIDDAVNRRPPFKRDKEAGFRDALVCETLLQIADSSPRSPGICRIALIVQDKDLRDVATGRTSDRKNVTVLASCTELSHLINTLVADVTEAFVAEIRKLASRAFYEPGDNTTLYYRERVLDRLMPALGLELSKLPSGATRSEITRYSIGLPSFVRKKGQRVFWATRISIEAKAVRELRPPPPFVDVGYGSPAFWGSDVITSAAAADVAPPASQSSPDLGAGVLWQPTLAGQIWVPPRSLVEAVAAVGRWVFEVSWSVEHRPDRTLGKPRIDNIELAEGSWG